MQVHAVQGYVCKQYKDNSNLNIVSNVSKNLYIVFIYNIIDMQSTKESLEYNIYYDRNRGKR